MKKFLIRLKTIFLLLMIFVVCLTPVFLTLMAFASCLTSITVSAAETTTSETAPPLIYDFGSVPLNVKSKLYSDDELQYPYYFILRISNGKYMVLFFKEKVDYLYVNSESDTYLRSSEKINYTYVLFNVDGSYSGIGSTYYAMSFDGFGSGRAYGYVSSSDRLQNYIDNIVYSSFDIKCNGMTIYFAKNNKKVTIKDLLDLPAGTGGGEIVGPQPIPSDSKTLYGGYVEKNEETWSAFLAWLVENEYYTDLAKYGLVVTASNIGSIADTWYENKMSPTLFFEIVKQNGVNSLSSAEKIIGWFNRKWQEYISHNYEKIQVGTGGTKSDPHHRANLITDETDEDGNITDTLDISILRDILRRLIEIPNDIYSFFGGVINNIANNIYSLCLYAYDMPENVANAIYNNFVEPLNLILDAINNSDNSGSDNGIFDDFYNKLLAVFIPDDAYMTSWTNDVTSLINSKFGFLSQFAELKQTIDDYCFPSETLLSASVDDGQLELEEYMNYPDFSLTAFETEHIKLNSKVRIIDWSTFDKYRLWFHRVVVAICYVIFITRRFKRSPNVVANNDIAN